MDAQQKRETAWLITINKWACLFGVTFLARKMQVSSRGFGGSKEWHVKCIHLFQSRVLSNQSKPLSIVSLWNIEGVWFKKVHISAPQGPVKIRQNLCVLHANKVLDVGFSGEVLQAACNICSKMQCTFWDLRHSHRLIKHKPNFHCRWPCTTRLGTRKKPQEMAEP